MLHLLFDLDGTLTDSAEGIARSFQHAQRALGREPWPADALRRYVGPPLRDAFAEALETADEDLLAQAIRHYDERYQAAGMFENRVFDGVPDGLARLKTNGCRLWVVTSKPRIAAVRIIEYFNLAGWFDAVYGPLGENVDKALLVEELVRVENLPRDRAWMIGDRRHDIAAARQNGIGAIGVLWGYGTRDELVESGAQAVVASMIELCELVEGLSRRPGADGR